MDNVSTVRHYCKEVEKYQNPRGGYFTPGSLPVSARPRWDGSSRDARPYFAGERQTAACHLCWPGRTRANSGTEVSQ
ncbi:hypothetical protein ACLB1M_31155 [Escherichia coli]